MNLAIVLDFEQKKSSSLESYLAGFESYYIQELKGLVDSFREKEGTWTGIAQNEWLQGNPLLLAEVPSELKSQESNLEVSERLRQLSTALKKTRMHEVHSDFIAVLS